MGNVDTPFEREEREGERHNTLTLGDHALKPGSVTPALNTRELSTLLGTYREMQPTTSTKAKMLHLRHAV